MNHPIEKPAHPDLQLNADEAMAVGAWLAHHLGADSDAVSTALARTEPDKGGAVLLPTRADKALLDRLAGPALLDSLLDRADLPAAALVMVDRDASTIDLRPGSDDDHDGGESDTEPAQQSRQLRTSDGFCDTLAVQSHLQRGSVQAVQIRDAWRWLPTLRPMAQALDNLLQWHARFDLLLLSPGATVECAIVRPDHLFLVQVFGNARLQFTDANPAFDERVDWKLGLPPKKPPLRRATCNVEPGDITHCHLHRALGISLASSPSLPATPCDKQDGASLGQSVEAEDMTALHQGGWSVILCVALNKPRWGEVMRHRFTGDRLRKPWNAPALHSNALPAMLAEGESVGALLDRYWHDRRDHRMDLRDGRLLDLMASPSIGLGSLLMVRDGHEFERIDQPARRPGVVERRLGLPGQPAGILLRVHGNTVLNLLPGYGGWIDNVLGRHGSFTPADLPHPPKVAERGWWANQPVAARNAAEDPRLALCRRLLAAGVLRRSATR